MAAHQREKGSQKAASLRRNPVPGQGNEFLDLQKNEGQTENAGDDQKKLGPKNAFGIGRRKGKSTGETRCEKASRLPFNAGQFHDLTDAGTAGRCPLQHRIGCEEAREHDDVAEQEYPKSVSYDDALAGGAGLAMAGTLHRSSWRVMPMADSIRVLAKAADCFDAGRKIHVAHGAIPPSLSSRRKKAVRAARRARSTRATTSAGTSNSWTSRQARITKPMKAP